MARGQGPTDSIIALNPKPGQLLMFPQVGADGIEARLVEKFKRVIADPEENYSPTTNSFPAART